MTGGALEPRVYRSGWGGTYLLGPLDAWKVGDVVELPEHEHGTLRGTRMPAATVEVVRIESDGAAVACDKAKLDAQRAGDETT